VPGLKRKNFSRKNPNVDHCSTSSTWAKILRFWTLGGSVQQNQWVDKISHTQGDQPSSEANPAAKVHQGGTRLFRFQIKDCQLSCSWVHREPSCHQQIDLFHAGSSETMSVPLQAQEQQHCLLSYWTARKIKSEHTLKQKSMHVGLQYPE